VCPAPLSFPSAPPVKGVLVVPNKNLKQFFLETCFFLRHSNFCPYFQRDTGAKSYETARDPVVWVASRACAPANPRVS
jgi:hypothetical protein